MNPRFQPSKNDELLFVLSLQNPLSINHACFNMFAASYDTSTQHKLNRPSNLNQTKMHASSVYPHTYAMEWMNRILVCHSIFFSLYMPIKLEVDIYFSAAFLCIRIIVDIINKQMNNTLLWLYKYSCICTE